MLRKYYCYLSRVVTSANINSVPETILFSIWTRRFYRIHTHTHTYMTLKTIFIYIYICTHTRKPPHPQCMCVCVYMRVCVSVCLSVCVCMCVHTWGCEPMQKPCFDPVHWLVLFYQLDQY